MLDRFAALARSLDGCALSVDATGGFDSRLVLCLLDAHGLPFELATSGRPGAPDTEVARAVARLLWTARSTLRATTSATSTPSLS